MSEITVTLKFPLKGWRQEKEARSVPDFADDLLNDPDLVVPLHHRLGFYLWSKHHK